VSEANPKRDLAGMTFGLWRVLGPFRRQGKHQHIHWLVECSCEAKTQRYVVATNLTGGLSTNCGCVRTCKLSQIMSRPRSILQPLDDLDEEERAERKELRERLFRRFQLVQTRSKTGIWWGCFDAETGHQEIVSEFRHVAERHIKELIAAEEAQETQHYAA
jgi:hypothetical protein